MSLDRRAHVGWEVRCDATGCTETTATAAPPVYRRSESRAIEAAVACGWVHVVLVGETRWVCPMHQTWDPRLDRWVATPLAVTPEPVPGRAESRATRRQPTRSSR